MALSLSLRGRSFYICFAYRVHKSLRQFARVLMNKCLARFIELPLGRCILTIITSGI